MLTLLPPVNFLKVRYSVQFPSAH